MIVDDVQDPRTSRINLVQIKTRITNRQKNWNILPFREAIKIKEKTTDFEHWFRTLVSKLLRTF